jgi:hypothetical protein
VSVVCAAEVRFLQLDIRVVASRCTSSAPANESKHVWIRMPCSTTHGFDTRIQSMLTHPQPQAEQGGSIVNPPAGRAPSR